MNNNLTIVFSSHTDCLSVDQPWLKYYTAAKALWAMGIKRGKHVLSMFPVLPHESFLFCGIGALYQIAPRYTAAEVCDPASQIAADLFFVFDFILTPEMERMVYENTNVRHIIVANCMPLAGRDKRTISGMYSWRRAVLRHYRWFCRLMQAASPFVLLRK